jgi:hypothetical protein
MYLKQTRIFPRVPTRRHILFGIGLESVLGAMAVYYASFLDMLRIKKDSERMAQRETVSAGSGGHECLLS